MAEFIEWTHFREKISATDRLTDIQLEKGGGGGVVKLGRKFQAEKKNYVASFDKLQIPSVIR